jgi:hypothetical protein
MENDEFQHLQLVLSLKNQSYSKNDLILKDTR